MEKQTELLTNDIINEFAKTVEMFDLSPSEARLFAFLYLNITPMTLDDMGNALGKSKTSMSTCIRSLLDLNLVTRVWKKGVRKDLYQANANLFKNFMDTYVNKWVDAASHQKESLDELSQRMNSQSADGKDNPELKSVKKRLYKIMEFHTEIENAFRSIKKL